jgi:glutamate synthase domain-containing protein 3
MRTFIDLEKNPPRSGSEMLGGFAWLARMTDKARAKHAGMSGGYVSLCPMDEGFLQRCAVAAGEFQELIASENDDEQIASYFERHVGPAQREAANKWVLVEQREHVDELDREEGRTP